MPIVRLSVGLMLLGWLGVQALDESALSAALALGRGQRFDRLREFHAAYHLPPAQPVVMELDVVTLYRRAVLLATESARKGIRWTTRDLAQALIPFAEGVAVHANVRLHPHNVLVTPPPYTIELRDPAGRRIAPAETDRRALYPPRAPREGAAMSALSLEATFDRATLAHPDCCTVVILDPSGAIVLEQPIPFARLR